MVLPNFIYEFTQISSKDFTLSYCDVFWLPTGRMCVLTPAGPVYSSEDVALYLSIFIFCACFLLNC